MLNKMLSAKGKKYFEKLSWRNIFERKDNTNLSLWNKSILIDFLSYFLEILQTATKLTHIKNKFVRNSIIDSIRKF